MIAICRASPQVGRWIILIVIAVVLLLCGGLALAASFYTFAANRCLVKTTCVRSASADNYESVNGYFPNDRYSVDDATLIARRASPFIEQDNVYRMMQGPGLGRPVNNAMVLNDSRPRSPNQKAQVAVPPHDIAAFSSLGCFRKHGPAGKEEVTCEGCRDPGLTIVIQGRHVEYHSRARSRRLD